MQTILVANPKGGSGKTTLATNVAGWLAGKRQRVALTDIDPQQSSAQWLARRPRLFPAIGTVGRDGESELRRLDPLWQVVDSAAGMHGDDLKQALKGADVLLVPVSASAFDIAATQRFLAIVAETKAVKKGRLAIGLVAMRVDARTHSAAELDVFLGGCAFPRVAQLRDAQIYVHCARDGASVFDLPRSRAEHDWEQWRPLTRWLARQAPRVERPA
ncbi:MAG: ParA family protein [Betaproteobacteria bacterium]|jgi:chromosome partitioning protein|nr:ParA family protein [Betaproteobacteria bacterium]MBK6602715.1 ParA family protein [Betaproteobacteria bacterium]MBK7081072.1 ParA family protein [Betaproteobacteria bacterium]MBK9676617.1 ParA family protein [Betaproteobacteria bacterium]